MKLNKFPDILPPDRNQVVALIADSSYDIEEDEVTPSYKLSIGSWSPYSGWNLQVDIDEDDDEKVIYWFALDNQAIFNAFVEEESKK